MIFFYFSKDFLTTLRPFSVFSFINVFQNWHVLYILIDNKIVRLVLIGPNPHLRLLPDLFFVDFSASFFSRTAAKLTLDLLHYGPARLITHKVSESV